MSIRSTVVIIFPLECWKYVILPLWNHLQSFLTVLLIKVCLMISEKIQIYVLFIKNVTNKLLIITDLCYYYQFAGFSKYQQWVSVGEIKNFAGGREAEEEWFWQFKPSSKLKSALCEYWKSNKNQMFFLGGGDFSRWGRISKFLAGGGTPPSPQ